MRSMTGFGIGEASIPQGKMIVEIRGVNHRFLDVRVRLPRELNEVGLLFEQRVRGYLTRGRYEVYVRKEGAVFDSLSLNEDRARSVYRSFCALRDELAPHAEVPFTVLTAIPDLLTSSSETQLEAVHTAMQKALDLSIRSLDEMRVCEGEALQKELCQQLEKVRALVQQIKQKAQGMGQVYTQRLQEKIARLCASIEIKLEPNRLEQEVAAFAEKTDIHEEITRLESHCNQFFTLLGVHGAVGKRIDFLLQEMVREINTIGSKSSDASMSHTVVELKAEVERMREQVQNIE